MAFEKKTSKVKTGRTPEQQAARDARKAAREAAAAVVEEEVDGAPETSDSVPTAAVVEVVADADADAESSSAAANPESRKRKHNEDVEELEVDLEAPTPLNKKEARLAKKKAKRGEAEVDSKEAAVAPKQPAVERRNSVWIGNLSFRTTEERLKEFMELGVKELGGESEGEGGCVTRVNLPKEAGKGGFANNKG